MPLSRTRVGESAEVSDIAAWRLEQVSAVFLLVKSHVGHWHSVLSMLRCTTLGGRAAILIDAICGAQASLY